MIWRDYLLEHSRDILKCQYLDETIAEMEKAVKILKLIHEAEEIRCGIKRG